MADPTTTQNINYGFAPEAAPYAQDVLGQAQALTDVNANPYQQYQGDTIAQFTPLQNLAYGNAATMSSAPQLQDASALAGQAGLGALNTQYTFNPANFNSAYSGATTRDAQGNVTGNSMLNPFLDVQNAATYRNAGIQNAQNNAQATLGGAFGGGRQAIMNSQANADLQRNLGQNQYNAYNQAQQQYNTQNQLNAQQQQFGAGLGLQGLQTANQAATNLANIGQTQYGQNMGINQLQAQYGGAQQQQVQNGLNQQQQQFLNYQNYPYQQLNFMQNMIRGLPMTNQTASVYQSPGSMLGQVAGLGIGAAAALNKKEGGSISSFKEGGYVKKYSGEDEESLVRLSPFAMKQLMGDATMSGAGVNANADLHEAGRLSGGVNLNRMDKGMDSRQMQSLMANYTNNIGDVGVNANVSRPLERNLPADFYQENLMGSIPVGEGRLSAGIHGTHVGGEHHKNAHSLAYNTPFHGGHLSANVIKPIEGKPSYGVQYNRSFSGGGDITDPSEGKLHRMMSDLSDEQLQLILQHPTSMAEMQSAQLAMSSRHGGMREGGAVAFAGGGSNDDTAQQANDRGAISNVFRHLNAAGMDILTLPGRGVAGAAESVITRPLRALGVPIPYLPESFYGGNRNSISPYSDKLMQEEDTNKYAKQKDDMSDYVTRRGNKAEDYKEAWKKPEIKAGLSDLVKNAPSLGEARKTAESMGTKPEDFDTIYKRILGDLSKGNSDIIKSIKELTEEQTGEAKNIKAEGDRKALMNFGFNLAAEASRPGVAGNQGFAGLLRSAAAASPSYAASLADTDKLARESQRLANQMQIEMTKYQVALDKGDKSAAVQAAHSIQTNQIHQQQLAETIAHNRATEKNQAAHTGMLAEHYKAAGNNNSFKLANLNARAIEMGKKQADSDYKSNLSLMSDKNMTPAKLAEQYSKQYYSQLLRSRSGPLMPLEE